VLPVRVSPHAMSMTVASQPVPGTAVGIGVGALVVGCKVGAEDVGHFVELKFGAPVGITDGALVVGFKVGVELSSDWHVSSIVYSPT